MRYPASEKLEIIRLVEETLYGHMELVRLLNGISRQLGARNRNWTGRKGWRRVFEQLEASYGRKE